MPQLPEDSATGKFTYRGIIPVPDASKKELYTRAKLWLVTNLASHESHLNYHDEEASTVIGNGHFNIDYIARNSWQVRWVTTDIGFTVNISTKKDKYRYTITNFSFLIVAWNFPDGYGGIREINHVQQPLEDGLAITTKWISPAGKANRSAQASWFAEINAKVNEKITLLSQSMKVNILDDDNW